MISNSIVIFQNYKYDHLCENLDNQEVLLTAIVTNVSDDKYKIKVEDKKYKGIFLYLLCENKLEYGDEIKVSGKFYLPSTRRNYKGFDYKEYLKSSKIYGTIYSNEISVIQKDRGNCIFKYTNKLRCKIEEIIDNSKMKNDEKALVKGIIIGDKSDISEEMINDFSKSNISHILAISGLHISYIIIISSLVLDKIIGKHYSKIGTIFIILFYMGITSFSPSVLRAGITAIIHLIGVFIYRKDDNFNSLSLSLLILLIYNPFLLNNVGLKLSFMGTIGIIVFSSDFNKFINYHFEKLYRRAIRRNMVKIKLLFKILNSKVFIVLRKTIVVTISVALTIIPIILIDFNKVSITSLIISVLTSFIIGPIIVLSLFFIIFRFMFFQKVLSFFLRVLIYLSSVGAKLPFNQIYLVTPGILEIIFYYVLIFMLKVYLNINLTTNLNLVQIRIKNLISVFKYKIKMNKNRITSICLTISIIFSVIVFYPKNLKIYFVDVGQGDCTLILTPKNKSILIDGGGSKDFDVGKNTLMPYLLDRKVGSIDYVIISHLDMDHVGGILYLLQEMKVNNVIIGKQFEKSENYDDFIDIIKKKNINLYAVEENTKITIEKDVYFNIIWPSTLNAVSEKSINNNALVCKLNYKTFSCIFTGDIEEEAERRILNKGINLKSDILKVAHHGSKTSTTNEFLKAVSPKIALIGVGENNIYGHPSYDVIKKLEDMRIKIYRTDEDGEIMINVNKKGKIKIDKFIK